MRPIIPIIIAPASPTKSIPIIHPTTPQSHQDFDEDKTLKIPQPNIAKMIKSTSIVSIDMSDFFSGNAMTSHRRRGDIRSIPSLRPVSKFPALKWGVKFSSIILLDMRSVITHSSPRPTSIRISLSVGAMSMRRPLSSPF